MQRKLVSALLVTCLVLSSIPVFFHLSPVDVQQEVKRIPTPLNFDLLTEEFGDNIPVVVKFTNGFSQEILEIIVELNLEFTLGTPEYSHVGSNYLLEGSRQSLEALYEMGVISEISPQIMSQHLHAPRDVSIPEINADDVWEALDDLGRNVTGEGILIADLDTGVDWRHPDLWFPDGGTFMYVNSTSTGFVNATDAVDLNADYALTPDEAIYCLDLNDNGIFDVRKEWVWVDNVTQNAFPDPGEPFFVVNDTNGNGLLEGNEDLVMLGTPKTKYIVEMDGTAVPQLQVWARDENLTLSTHQDTMTNGGGHGTAVASILLGGQLGYRDYVGVAPDAELMMIRVLADENTNKSLSIYAGLAYANATGADVIITEVGSWTYHYLDGSSLVEEFIDDLVADGIPVISPSGNLGSSDKHCMFTTTPDIPYLVDFMLPPAGGEISQDINNVYITVLSVNPTDFGTCDFSLIMDRSSFGLLPITVNLLPGIGYENWAISPGPINFEVYSFISISDRGTSMLAIKLTGNLPTITSIPWHKLNVTSPDPTIFHGYISDDRTSWSGGCTWTSDVSNDYLITWPSTADNAISVASYNTRFGIIGELATYSSRGPRIDGITKQSISAPGGFDIISAYANGTPYFAWYNSGGLPFGEQFASYRLFSGTSAAGPHVAGCAALLLQIDPTCGSQVKSIVESTARNDTFTGAVPNPDWGSGKLDVDAAAWTLLVDTDPPEFGLHIRTPVAPNATDTVSITIDVTDSTGVDTVILSYSNGSTWTNITMIGTGPTYQANIPAFPSGTTVEYKFYANDTLGFSVVSSTYSYTVTTSTTTTTSTETTSGTGSTIPDNQLDTLRLILLLTGVLVLVVIYVVYSRRRSK